jgi:carboxylesterase
VPVDPHARPFSAEGGRTGVLVLHGFTGSTAGLRPWAEAFAADGYAVEAPRLPGHGTTWQELNRTRWQDWLAEASNSLTALRDRCDEVFVAGLSMGGCLALRLAEEREIDVAGLILVNPIVISQRKALLALPLLKRLRPSVGAIADDIKRPGVTEHAYARTPLRALDSQRELWRVTREDLAKITAPLVLFRSVEDHVVEPLSSQMIVQRVSSRDVTERVVDDSYHVATLDNDAETITVESLEFIRKHTALPDGDDAF